MRFAPPEEWRSSLRVRLAAWNTLVVLTTVVLALLAVREGLRLTLLRELDERLVEEITEAELIVARFYPDIAQIREEFNRKAISHAHERIFLELRDASGRVLVNSLNDPSRQTSRTDVAPDHAPADTPGAVPADSPTAPLEVPSEALPEVATAEVPVAAGAEDITAALPHGSATTMPVNWSEFRVLERPLNRPQLPKLRLLVGSTRALIQADVAATTRLIVRVGLVLLPLATLGGYFLAVRATKPLRRIIETAHRLRPAKFEERLPVSRVGDELDQLSLTINHLLDRIAEYLQRNREFLANAAHELRSPLAAIQSSVEVGLNADRSPEEYKELLYELVEQCWQLRGLVNQLLQLAESDVDRPTLAADRVRLDLVVAKSLDMFRAVAEERGIDLRSSYLVPTEVRGDADQLWQVVNNLLDNGLKFTPTGGRVTVQLHGVPASREVHLTIADTGCGIDAEDLPRIFDRFFQTDKSRQRDRRGSGLGLSICEAILHAHGGQITVTSTPGAGTQFSIVLPAFTADEHESQLAEAHA
jgi:heavy metal sensor kinase